MTGLSLPAPRTGPASVESSRSRAFTRHAVPSDLRETISAARKSGFLPASIKTDEQAIVAAMKGRELGLPPMQSFAAIHVIQGVPTLSASLMLGVAFKRLPQFDYAVVKWDATVCHLRGRRSASHSYIDAAYHMADAERAGLASKDNWRKNPKAMLFARACGVLCRAVAPDTFMGLYTTEEIQDGDAVEGPLEPVQPVEIPAQATVTTEAPPAAVAPEPSAEANELAALMADLKTAGETGGEVKAAIKARGWEAKPKKEWTLDMARQIAIDIKLPGHTDAELNPFQ